MHFRTSRPTGPSKSSVDIVVLAIAALLLALSPGCEPDPPASSKTEEPPPPTVTIGVIHQHPADLRFVVDGRTIALETFVVTFGVTELHLCEEALFDLQIIPSAHAHVPSTGTRLGTVFAEDLMSAPGTAQIVGDFEPINGTYCRAVLVAAPADDDVVNLSPLPGDELVGNSAVIAGTIDGEPFRWATSHRVLARVALDDETIETGADMQLLFDKRVERELFAEVFEEESDSRRAEVVLERLMTTVERWSR